jgi:hypothetical protein
MDENSHQPNSEDDQPLFIFIGKQVSASEVQILKLPTFYDAFQLSLKPPAVKENPTYQYVNLDCNNQIQFNFMDGNEKKSGKVALNKENLVITLEQPSNSLLSYLLIQKGNKLSYLTFPPNNKIKLKQKDISNSHSQTKEME